MKIYDIDAVIGAGQEVMGELSKATENHAPMHSAHEGWAVIREEVDELWEEVKKRHQDIPSMRKEAIQVAAMAIRFVVDVCDREDRREENAGK